jgi:hypothetical protein
MVDPRNGTKYDELCYQGYGVFGGKDYFELLAELNGKNTRDEGIDLESKHRDMGVPIVFPILVEDPYYWERYKNDYDGPVIDPFQGSNSELEIDCSNCSRTVVVRSFDLMNHAYCPYCGRNIKNEIDYRSRWI